MPSTVRAADLTDQPLDPAAVRRMVELSAAGGVAVFTGIVRDHDAGREVTRLDYTAHPTAARVLDALAGQVAGEYDVLAVAALHRVGELVVGDTAVVTAVAAVHRGEAFAACQALIDRLKQTVPIWKHQRFADGTEEWVGTP